MARDLNYALRRKFTGGWVVLMAGVAALPGLARAALLGKVCKFDRSDDDNEPHAEHDFGVLALTGYCCFWKIECHNRVRWEQWPDLTVPPEALRVLTIMLAEES